MEEKIVCACGWSSLIRVLRRKGCYVCYHCGREFKSDEQIKKDLNLVKGTLACPR
jgi:DNA-directed RNA polymerase subunit RPC12/RpoP